MLRGRGRASTSDPRYCPPPLFLARTTATPRQHLLPQLDVRNKVVDCDFDNSKIYTAVIQTIRSGFATVWLKGILNPLAGQCQMDSLATLRPWSVAPNYTWHGGQAGPLCARQRAWLQGHRGQCQVRAQA